MLKEEEKKSNGEMNQITQQNVMNQLWIDDIDGV